MDEGLRVAGEAGRRRPQGRLPDLPAGVTRPVQRLHGDARRRRPPSAGRPGRVPGLPRVDQLRQH